MYFEEPKAPIGTFARGDYAEPSLWPWLLAGTAVCAVVGLIWYAFQRNRLATGHFVTDRQFDRMVGVYLQMQAIFFLFLMTDSWPRTTFGMWLLLIPVNLVIASVWPVYLAILIFGFVREAL